MSKRKKEFGYYASTFLSDYLPAKKGCSGKTVESYRDTMVLFIEFMHGRKGKKVRLADIDVTAVEDFLDGLESERGNSVATRNQRQAAINSFLSYVRAREPELYGQFGEVLDIPRKKAPKPVMAYLTVEETAALLGSIDESGREGLRDKAMIAFLYETAARVGELVGCKACQVRLGQSPYVELHGKGGKERNVPVTQSFAKLLGDYMEAYGVEDGDALLFTNRYGQQLTQKGVSYVLRKRLAALAETEPGVGRKQITCHSMRHSRAVHLLEAGVNLIYIRDVLGHASVTTTEIYAKVSVEAKRKHLEKHSATYSTGGKYTPEEKDDLIKWLKDNF